MDQQKLINLILDGNEEFFRNHNDEYFKNHETCQSPFITLVTCSDSRVQTAEILPDPVNRIFSIENIGNQIKTAEGSVDFGVTILKTPVLLIVGHSDCGAVKAFMKGYETVNRNIKKELNMLPLSMRCSDKHDDGKFESDLHDNILVNIDFQVDYAISKYKELINNGELVVIGAFFDFRNEFKKGYGRLVITNINGKTQLL